MRKPNIWPIGVQGGETRKNENRDSSQCYNNWELSKIEKEYQGIGREALGTVSRLNKNKCALWYIIDCREPKKIIFKIYQDYLQRSSNKTKNWFLNSNNAHRRQWNVFNVRKQNNSLEFYTQWMFPSTIKIKIFSDKWKLRGFFRAYIALNKY